MAMSWEWAAKIEYGTIPLIVLSGSLFIASIYPQEFRRSVLYFTVGANALLVIAALLASSSILSPLLLVIQIFALALVSYAIYVILKALISGRIGAWITSGGITAFAVVGFYNIYIFLTLSDLNRTVIHSGYALALVLNVISLLYRTPMRIRSEEEDILRFSDFYSDREKAQV